MPLSAGSAQHWGLKIGDDSASSLSKLHHEPGSAGDLPSLQQGQSATSTAHRISAQADLLPPALLDPSPTLQHTAMARSPGPHAPGASLAQAYSGGTPDASATATQQAGSCPRHLMQQAAGQAGAAEPATVLPDSSSAGNSATEASPLVLSQAEGLQRADLADGTAASAGQAISACQAVDPERSFAPLGDPGAVQHRPEDSGRAQQHADADSGSSRCGTQAPEAAGLTGSLEAAGQPHAGEPARRTQEPGSQASVQPGSAVQVHMPACRTMQLVHCCLTSPTPGRSFHGAKDPIQHPSLQLYPGIPGALAGHG